MSTHNQQEIMAELEKLRVGALELEKTVCVLVAERNRFRGVVETIAEMAGDGPAATMCRAALEPETENAKHLERLRIIDMARSVLFRGES